MGGTFSVAPIEPKIGLKQRLERIDSENAISISSWAHAIATFATKSVNLGNATANQAYPRYNRTSFIIATKSVTNWIIVVVYFWVRVHCPGNLPFKILTPTRSLSPLPWSSFTRVPSHHWKDISLHQIPKLNQPNETKVDISFTFGVQMNKTQKPNSPNWQNYIEKLFMSLIQKYQFINVKCNGSIEYHSFSCCTFYFFVLTFLLVCTISFLLDFDRICYSLNFWRNNDFEYYGRSSGVHDVWMKEKRKIC